MEMQMKNMKMPNGKKNKGLSVPESVSQSPYPWGLTINLEDASMEKLGLEAGDYSPGDVLTLHARCEVTDVSEHKGKGGENCSMTIQITDMALGMGKMDKHVKRQKSGPGE